MFYALISRRKQYSFRSTKQDAVFYSYEYYREHFHTEIAEDCAFRCVYCDSHENEVGGREAMEIDHFRPWSLPIFSSLRNDPNNFVHSCRRCNQLKWNHWPSKTDDCHSHGVGFIDPFCKNRTSYFFVNEDGSLSNKIAPSEYVSRLLQLDRPYLRLLRTRRILRKKVNQYIEKMLPEISAAAAGKHSSLTKQDLAKHWLKLREYHLLLDLCDAPIGEVSEILDKLKNSPIFSE